MNNALQCFRSQLASTALDKATPPHSSLARPQTPSTAAIKLQTARVYALTEAHITRIGPASTGETGFPAFQYPSSTAGVFEDLSVLDQGTAAHGTPHTPVH